MLECDLEKQLSPRSILRRGRLCIPPRWQSHTRFLGAIFHLASSSSEDHTIEKQNTPHHFRIARRKFPVGPEESPGLGRLFSSDTVKLLFVSKQDVSDHRVQDIGHGSKCEEK